MGHFLDDGYFHLDHLAFGELAEGAVLSRGYAANLPDVTAVDPATQAGVERDFCTILSHLAIFAQPLKKVKFVVLRTDWLRCATA